MNASFRNRQLPYTNPVANALVVIVGVIAIAVSFVLGVVAFVALASVVVVLAAIVGIRVWWLSRKMRSAHLDAAVNGRGRNDPASRNATVIEGEYRVIPGKKDPS